MNCPILEIMKDISNEPCRVTLYRSTDSKPEAYQVTCCRKSAIRPNSMLYELKPVV